MIAKKITEFDLFDNGKLAATLFVGYHRTFIQDLDSGLQLATSTHIINKNVQLLLWIAVNATI